MSADPWVALDRDVGVSVFFSVDADGRVVTPAPRVAASRERSATDRDDLGRAQRIAALITAHLGLSAVARPSGGNVEVDLSSDGWLGRCGAETGIIAGAATDVRRARPPLRSFGQSLTWDAVAQDIGAGEVSGSSELRWGWAARRWRRERRVRGVEASKIGSDQAPCPEGLDVV